jgi:hypothetical protein
MEDDLKKIRNERRPQKNLFSIPLKSRGKHFLGLAQLSKILIYLFIIVMFFNSFLLVFNNLLLHLNDFLLFFYHHLQLQHLVTLIAESKSKFCLRRWGSDMRIVPLSSGGGV